MLQFLVCADTHTYTDNIRLAAEHLDRIDAILIAGDLEAEQDELLKAAGGIPCYAVCGNNDHYLKTAYPEELLIDLSAGSGSTPPGITNVKTLLYSSLPEKYTFLPESLRKKLLSGFLSDYTGKPFIEKKPPEVSHRIFITHGNEYHLPDPRLLLRRGSLWNADIVIFGHTHQYFDLVDPDRKIRLLNPGSLVGTPHSRILLNTSYVTCSFALLQIGENGEVNVQHLFI